MKGRTRKRSQIYPVRYIMHRSGSILEATTTMARSAQMPTLQRAEVRIAAAGLEVVTSVAEGNARLVRFRLMLWKVLREGSTVLTVCLCV